MNKLFFYGLVCMFFLHPFVVFGEADNDISSPKLLNVDGISLEIDQVLTTRFGSVLAAHNPDTGFTGTGTILFQGRILFEGDGPVWLSSPNIQEGNQVFSFTDRDVLLFGAKGTKYSPDELHFLILTPKGVAKVTDEKDFYSADSTYITPRREGDRIIVDLGYEQQKRKTATLQGDKVLVSYQVAPKTPMREESCKGLYEYIILWECVNPPPHKRECETMRDYKGVSNIQMTNYRLDSQHPGFDAAAFGEMCVHSCRTNRAVSYEKFEKRVCSRP